MKLSTYNRDAVITETYTFSEDGETYVLKEYQNEDGKVIDSTVLDSTGISLNDPALLERLQGIADQYHQGLIVL